MLIRLACVMTERLRSDRGATAVEYALMVSLIAVAIIVAVMALGTRLSALFNEIIAAI
ncbi:MAG TPA: Flp family type IVb pilin [Catenuloplanes sp.]|jgi:pilus assembly protein Flp/PilA